VSPQFVWEEVLPKVQSFWWTTWQWMTLQQRHKFSLTRQVQ